MALGVLAGLGLDCTAVDAFLEAGLAAGVTGALRPVRGEGFPLGVGGFALEVAGLALAFTALDGAAFFVGALAGAGFALGLAFEGEVFAAEAFGLD